MHTTLLVVDNPKKFTLDIPHVRVISPREYLTSTEFSQIEKATVYNLSTSYRYQTWGYYVSLLADARGHKVFPSITTIQDFKSQTIIRSISEELNELFQDDLEDVTEDKFELSIYFSKNVEKQYDKLAKELYDLFQAPLLRASFVKQDGEWELQNISPIDIGSIPLEHKPYILDFAKEYFTKKSHGRRQIIRPYMDLAILVDPDEKEPPSDPAALEKFVKIGASKNIRVEMITKEDYNELPSYDALFIRTTTAVNHYTYRFARFAQTEGLVVIDDPVSILKCTNKVYLAELLTQENIPVPQTIIVHRKNLRDVAKTMSYPSVLKQPDGSFSMGVTRAENAIEFLQKSSELLEHSDVIIAQQFMLTEFDWRVGVLDGKPIFACKYHMANNHWQIYNWESEDKENWGKTEVMPVYMVPQPVLDVALKATKIIGNGLYGVDLKQLGDQVYIIEVNDNPNLDHGYEDRVLKDQLYTIVLDSFIDRFEKLNRSRSVTI